MCESWEDCEQVRDFFIFHRNCVKCVQEWNIWKSNKNQNSYTILTLNGKFTSNSQLLQSKALFDILFTEIVFSIKTHKILIWIEWDLFHCVLEEKSFHMNSSCCFLVLVEISLSVHGFVVVHPMFTKFDSLSYFEPYQDWKTSTSLTHMHTQGFRKIHNL